MRSYDVALTSVAIRAPRKWTDNILSHHTALSVGSRGRGVSRRISYPTLLLIALTRQLHTELGIGVGDALALGAALLSDDDTNVLERGQLRLTLDRESFERALQERVRDALESAPLPRRGRPPGTQDQRRRAVITR